MHSHRLQDIRKGLRLELGQKNGLKRNDTGSLFPTFKQARVYREAAAKEQ